MLCYFRLPFCQSATMLKFIQKWQLKCNHIRYSQQQLKTIQSKTEEENRGVELLQF